MFLHLSVSHSRGVCLWEGCLQGVCLQGVRQTSPCRDGSRIPRRRGRQPSGRGCQHTILPNFPKNCMKMRKFWAVGVARAGSTPLPLDPPLPLPRASHPSPDPEPDTPWTQRQRSLLPGQAGGTHPTGMHSCGYFLCFQI